MRGKDALHECIRPTELVTGGPVDCVWRHGCKVVSGGRHVAREQIATRYREKLATILS